MTRLNRLLGVMLAAAVALCMCAATVPGRAWAEDAPSATDATGVFEVAGTGYGTLSEAVAAVTADDATITMTGDGTTGSVTIGRSSNVILDLNGYTLSVNSSRILVQGKLTVRDSSKAGTGEIAGIQSVSGSGPVQVQSGGSLVLNGGKISSEKSFTVNVNAALSSFTMEGGTLSGTNPLRLQYGASATILGGTLKSTEKTAVLMDNGAAKLTIGATGSEGPELRGAIEIGASLLSDGKLNVLSGSVSGGIIGAGKIPVEPDIQIGFTQEVAESLIPAGYKCIQEDGLYYIQKIPVEQPVAQISKGNDEPVQYGSVAAAVSALASGDTLQLLQDVEGQVIVEKAPNNVTIDLNGHSITTDDDYALVIKGAHASTVTVKNSSADTSSTLQGAKAAVRAYGVGLDAMTLDFQGSNIELNPANAGIELGDYARMTLADGAEQLITSGGFRTTIDGIEYAYGTLAAAAEDCKGSAIELMNDYNGDTPMVIRSEGAYTLDMGGHTYTSSAECVLRVGWSKAELTVKNGSIVSTSELPKANIAGIYEGDAGIGNAKLTLEGVTLEMEQSGNTGIIVNGNNTQNTLTLDGCTLTVPDDVMGIYFPPASSELIIKDTTITAGTGICIKGGTLTVSGESAIHAKGTPDDLSAGIGAGANETGDAIYIEGNYADRTVEVNIEGGTFKSDEGKPIQKLFDESRPANRPIDVAITGGSFSGEVPDEFLGEGAGIETNDDGSISVHVHDLEHVSGNAATCTEDGEQEHYVCSQCGALFFDEAMTKPVTDEDDLVIPATNHKGAEHHDAVAPTCTEDGNVEYWYCPSCGSYFLDEDLSTPVDKSETVVAATHHANAEHVGPVAPTCTTNGNVEYWHCPDCDSYFLDENKNDPVEKSKTVIEATGHSLEHIAGKAATCTETGVEDHYKCSKCGELFLDKDAKQPVDKDKLVIEAIGHKNAEHVEAVEPTEVKPGNYEYWYCPDCEKYFADEACTQETTLEEVTRPVVKPVTHTITFQWAEGVTVAKDVRDGEAIVPPTDAPAIDGWVFTGRWFLDEACTKEFDAETMLATEDMTLYAGWVPAKTEEDDSNKPSDEKPNAENPKGDTLEQTGDNTALIVGAVAAAGVVALGAGIAAGKKRLDR